MTDWSQLPIDLVQCVLSQPGVSCDAKIEIGKELGWNLIGKVQIPEGLEQKLNRIHAARVTQTIRHRTQLYEIVSEDNKIKLEYHLYSRSDYAYSLIVRKKKVQIEYNVMQSGTYHVELFEWYRRTKLPE